MALYSILQGERLRQRDASVEQFVSVQYDRLTEHLSHIPKNDYIARFIELDCHGHVWKDKVYQALVSEFAIEGMNWQSLLEDYEMQFQLHCVPFQFLTEMLNELIDELSEISGILTQFNSL